MEDKKAKGFKMPEIKLPEKHKKVLLVAVLILGIGMLLTSYRSVAPSEDMRVDEPIVNVAPVVSHSSPITQAETALEQRLEGILSQINGVGNISVKVTLRESPEYEYAVNVSTSERSITENDQSGGSRVTLDTTESGQLVLVRSANNSGEVPVVVKKTKPEIVGVLVVAQGANNPLVKAELTRAVQTLLGVNINQVKVVSGERR